MGAEKIEGLKSLFFEREDPKERLQFQQLYEEICSMVKQELLPQLSSLSFIMFKPDTYLRGIISEVLAYLNLNGIYVSQFKVKKLSSEMIDRLYMFVKPKYISSWWIMEKAYDAAPCVPMILVGQQDTWGHLSSKVRELLGPTTPLLGNEDQIRYRFRGTHRIFNILHGTDDPASAVRESRVFFTWDEISSALNHATQLVQGFSPQLPDPKEIQDKVTPPKTDDINYPRARLRLKLGALECVRKRLEIIQQETLSRGESGSGISLKLTQLFQDFASLLTKEQRILEVEYPLRVERNTLGPILELERMTCVLGEQLVTEAITRVAQDVQNYSKIQQKLAILYDVIDALIIGKAMSSDIEFRELGFSKLSKSAVRLGIPFGHLDWLVLHAGLSVLDTEFFDYVGKYKSVYLGENATKEF